MPIIGCDTFRFMSKCINLIFEDDFHNFLQKKLFTTTYNIALKSQFHNEKKYTYQGFCWIPM